MSEYKKNLFKVGHVVATPGFVVLMGDKDDHLLHMRTAHEFLTRHVTGDWGEVCREDAQSNDAAVKEGARILSAYTLNGQKFWIITEWDRSVTTFLLPEEY